MKSYKSFGALERALTAAAERMEATLQAVAVASAELVQSEAKSEFGTYQRENMGQFTPWAELSDYTKADRRQAGFPENEPLLRSGELRDSIEHSIGPLSFEVGSESPVMLWQELGITKTNLPPRPVLSTALFRMTEPIRERVGWAVKRNLEGRA